MNYENITPIKRSALAIVDKLKEQILNDLDEIIVNEMFKYSNKYKNLLTKEESQIVSEINNTSNKEELFNNYKNNCIKQLSEAKNKYLKLGDTETINRLDDVIDKVSNKKFIHENIATDLCGFMDLTKLFE